MKEFRVAVVVKATFIYEVEAANRADALGEAEEMARSGDLPGEMEEIEFVYAKILK